MSVWISDEKLLIFASLISPSKIILFEKKYQTFDTVFHHQMKHLEVRQKYSAARRIFNSLLGVSSGDETLHLMFDVLLQNIQKTFLNVENALNGTSLIRCNGKHSPNILTLSTTELQKLRTVRHLLAPSFDNLGPRS